MDLLKQLEAKMQTLLQQRNQLKEELDALKSAGAAGDQELQSLRARLEEAVADAHFASRHIFDQRIAIGNDVLPALPLPIIKQFSAISTDAPPRLGESTSKLL